MGVRIQQYTGQKFITTMPETGNQNPHHTLFAGSLFSLATLPGWGLIWLMLRERHLGGTIILADAHIRYSAPISAKSDWFPFPSRLTVTSAVTFVSAVIFSADASLGTSPRSMVVTRSPEY